LCDKCGAVVKPDVVLYEESLEDNTVMGAVKAISQADVLIVAGTSLTVYPAAGMIRYYTGDKLVLINRDETPMDNLANLIFHESVGELLGKVV
ncbi:MAG: SIR2 family NAD-dependent protein deacylase, partial [Ruminococcus sp.]